MKKVLSLILVCVMVLSLGSATFAASGKWVKYNGKYYYQKEDGSYCVSEWEKIDGKYYYFGSNGVVVTGWQKISGNYYYFGSDAVVVTGWQKIGGQYYYFGSDGILVQGVKKIGGKWYALLPSVQVGVVKVSDKLYYFGSDGAMVFNTVKTINGKVYYFTSNGYAHTGWLQYNSSWYYFKADGTMAANEVVEGYKFAANGVCTGKAQSGEGPVVTAYVSNGAVLKNLSINTVSIPNGPEIIRIQGEWANNTTVYYTGGCISSAYGIQQGMIDHAVSMYPSLWKSDPPLGTMPVPALETVVNYGFQKPGEYDNASTYYILALNTDANYNYIGYTIFTITK